MVKGPMPLGFRPFTAEAPVGGNDGKDQSDLDARLKRLSQDLGAKSQRHDAVPGSGPDADSLEEMARARSAGFRILGEFTAAIVAGALIGYFADRVVGTSPAFLIVFLILGMAAGFLNIYRVAAPNKFRAGAGRDTKRDG
jgi:ATP synthase protein I